MVANQPDKVPGVGSLRALRPVPNSAVVAVSSTGAMPFVGRQSEASQLAATFDCIRVGSARVVLISGDPGVGKSALVSDSCMGLAEQAIVVVGGCVDIPGVESAQVPFGPFVEALRRLQRTEHDEPTQVVLSAWLNPASVPDASHGPVHTRFAELLALLDRLTAVHPVVLVLEDLQWADQSSLALLVYLARNLTTQPVLLICTVRTHLSADSVAQATFDHLRRLPTVSVISLDRLPDTDILRIINEAAPQPLSKHDTEAIVARAEGNPLVARELAGNPNPQSTDAGSAWVPPTLAGSVRDRVRRCSPPARAVLAATAVLGGTADSQVVDQMFIAALPDLDQGGRASAVDEACGIGLLLPDGAGYRFRHGLDRDVIYRDLLPDQRRQLHAAAADALAARGRVMDPDVAARLATHWYEAGNPGAAQQFSLVAARTSARLSAYPEAHAHYERALGHWPTPIDTSEEEGGPGFDLLLAIAEVAALAGRPDRSVELARAAVDVATTVELRQQALECLVRFSSDGGDSAAALGLFDQASIPVEDDGAQPVTAGVLASHARSLMMTGRYAEADAQARRALAAVTLESDIARSGALITLGLIVAVTGDPDEGLDLLRQGRANAQTYHHGTEFWRAQVNTGYVLHSLGRYQESADFLLESLPTRATGVQDGRIALVCANAAESLILLGQWERANSVLAEGLLQPLRPREASWLLGLRVRLKLLVGDADAAQSLLARARASAVKVTDPEALADLGVSTAELALSRGDGVAARTAIDESLAVFIPMTEDPQLLLPALAVAGRIEAEVGAIPGLGDPDRLARLRALLAGRTALLAGHQRHAALEATFCGADLARAGGADDPEVWRGAADLAGDHSRPYLRAYALLRLAEAAIRSKNRKLAQPALAQAHLIAVGLGAAPLTQRIEQVARLMRLSLDQAPLRIAPDPVKSKTAAFGLTPREVEVLRLVTEGRTNRQIGKQLGMAEKTASVHVSRILVKLGAATRGEAAASALRTGLLAD